MKIEDAIEIQKAWGTLKSGRFTKKILISIKPEWVEKILNGKKTIEIRKTMPKCELPIKVYIYCTKIKDKKHYTDEIDIPLITKKWMGNGKVVAEFTLNKVEKIKFDTPMNFNSFNGGFGLTDTRYNFNLNKSCLTENELFEYLGEPTQIKGEYHLTYELNGYAWHIDGLKIYDEPRDLEEFFLIKECEPVNNFYGEKQTWEQRHKRCIASSRGIPIECLGCKNLVAGNDYLDEKSGVMLFDYSCKTNHHKPLKKAPSGFCYVEEV
ncbi:MAG: ASCH domain-containing protein [Clostridia bacterium]|nr:ASCH domain-containing protein [Clostridia bacterium]